VIKASDALQKLKSEVVLEQTSNTFRNLYNALTQSISPQVVELCFEQGYDAYTAKNYETAADLLGRVIQYDETNGDAYYYFGQSCRHLERNDEAIAAYKKVIELGPESAQRVKNSKDYLNRLQAN
jgi:tetratricopeptide (TPR) repeat protein